ncbi:uncharacterized protein EI90DRAFT_3122325 [Cantharellus anzutake]|uniref:uncharacterized protein n=1 Tax=Cantharellus anzutake TaxID=1750568 RepID=UPI0019085089|nr:uncharacterized protein EI90DRAFT_3122325 [Cantharellus anzutake]KAF8333260.1 hypothetical protein EI90DRAFT_3122325 [Cantharellus anzutake]
MPDPPPARLSAPDATLPLDPGRVPDTIDMSSSLSERQSSDDLSLDVPSALLVLIALRASVLRLFMLQVLMGLIPGAARSALSMTGLIPGAAGSALFTMGLIPGAASSVLFKLGKPLTGSISYP